MTRRRVELGVTGYLQYFINSGSIFLDKLQAVLCESSLVCITSWSSKLWHQNELSCRVWCLFIYLFILKVEDNQRKVFYTTQENIMRWIFWGVFSCKCLIKNGTHIRHFK